MLVNYVMVFVSDMDRSVAFRTRPTCSVPASRNTVIPMVWQFQLAKAATASGRA